MKCIVRKLKATIDNANLPVFENVVLKSYITTTQDEQYISLDDIKTPQSNTIFEVLYQTTSVTNLTLPVIGQTANTYIQQRNGYCRAFNTAQGSNVTVTADTDISAKMDTSDGSFNINGTTGTCSSPLESSYSSKSFVFATHNSEDDSLAGILKIMQVKITDKSTNDVYVLVPAEVNGVACLYDADRGVFYGEANGGTLVCG